MANGFLMNGMISHTFAALMTATVVLFPTPSDLWDAIIDVPPSARTAALIDAGMVRNFPLRIDENTSRDELIQALAFCADALGSTARVHMEECREIMAVAHHHIDEAGDFYQGHKPLAQHLLTLARSQFCRRLWAASNLTSETIDPQACLNESDVLADQT